VSRVGLAVITVGGPGIMQGEQGSLLAGGHIAAEDLDAILVGDDIDEVVDPMLDRRSSPGTPRRPE